MRQTPTECAHYIAGQIFEGDTVAPARVNSTAPRAPSTYYNITASDWGSVDPTRSDTAHQCAALVCYGAYCSENFADYALNRREMVSFCDTYWRRSGPSLSQLIPSSRAAQMTSSDFDSFDHDF